MSDDKPDEGSGARVRAELADALRELETAQREYEAASTRLREARDALDAARFRADDVLGQRVTARRVGDKATRELIVTQRTDRRIMARLPGGSSVYEFRRKGARWVGWQAVLTRESVEALGPLPGAGE